MPPSPSDFDGRTPDGRFAQGNRLSRGNPGNARCQRLRLALLAAVTPHELKAAARQLMKQAMGGDRAAFGELCDRTVGRAIQADAMQRIEALENAIQNRGV